MYKYGIPDGVDPKELRKKIAEMSKTTDALLEDPEFQEKVRRNASISGRISNKQFTI